MVNPWLALEQGADPAERVGQIGRAHQTFLAEGQMGSGVRAVVADSWRRSATSCLSPDSAAPVVLSDDALEDTAPPTRWPGCYRSSGNCSAG